MHDGGHCVEAGSDLGNTMILGGVRAGRVCFWLEIVEPTVDLQPLTVCQTQYESSNKLEHRQGRVAESFSIKSTARAEGMRPRAAGNPKNYIVPSRLPVS